MTPVADLPVPLREALCAHEALRRLGFPSEHIAAGFVEHARDPSTGYEGPGVVIALQVPGHHAFYVTHPDLERTALTVAGAADGDADALWPAAWKLAAESWAASTDLELAAVYFSSAAYRSVPRLREALARRGIMPGLAQG